MAVFRVARIAGLRIDEIYLYSRDRWGDEQARDYVTGLFDFFEDIAARRVSWRPVPADLGITGFHARYRRHYVYWRVLDDGAVGIVTVLHERMHRMARFRDDLIEP
ncbi:type II toxin-antitoxin system RelE/ParE family toxin [Sphingobium amiense]|uniref:Type II toxin-antitoxin system RelE/ParE family toxin n=1 Tax=Sphingobium amiense TaxID=135719 RepID=A0A494WFR1_9SPHN|nr:type II toxin-antitoxin system RelE/ParE family toxin [Sphingobium amiense]BBD99479.1 type II toxin-antitoxin system RelE/ParE family toxin [Sphingobium amiense]